MTMAATHRHRIPRWTRPLLTVPLLVFALVLMLFALALALALAPALAGSDSFIVGVEDLPLMPGLTEVRDAGIVFETPGGRIVETYAKGAQRRGDIFDFYRKTLPQLGWQPVGDSAYRRESERLEIVVLGGGDSGGSGELVVRFTLQPE
jgi:hypothetical protein